MTRAETVRTTTLPPQSGTLIALLSATVLGTVSNNVVNVPLRTITDGLGVDVASGVLVVSSFVLVLTVAMPLSGWLGDRIGRRRTLIAALGLMAVGMVGAGWSISLPMLVACRAVQGLACAAIPPCVMGMLSTLYDVTRRARMMSAWAAANGIGLACGPPLGGLLASLLGWRSIFFVLAPLSCAALAGCLRWVPPQPRRTLPLHGFGATFLTIGALLLTGAATLIGQTTTVATLAGGLAVLGAAFIAAFVIVSVRTRTPLIAPRLLVEPRFVRSGVAAFAQMFCNGVLLVAVPLYLTGELARNVAMTGLVMLVLPGVTALTSPVAGAFSDRISARWVLRCGLLILIVTECLFAWYMSGHGMNVTLLLGALALTGVGMALVQTPAAAGATRSPAGQAGAALGLFNMLRFAGTALAAAWVAIVYPPGQLLMLFAGCALLALVALLVTFAGANPVDTRSESAIQC